MTKIIDLSVSEEETNGTKLEQNKKMKEATDDFYDDNDIVSRFPSDRTDSIPKNLPTISNQFDTNTTEIS